MISGRRSARPTLCVRSFKDCIYLGIGRQATHAREERTDNNNNKKRLLELCSTIQYNTILATVLIFRQPTTTFSYIYVSVSLMLYTMQEGTVQSSP